jgi:alpha-beta hydrolase superfamily lysophospholipase
MINDEPARRVPLFRRLLPIPVVPAGRPAPATDEASSRARLAELMAMDADTPEATRTRFFEADGQARATVVIWHGFTNAPPQFGLVAEALSRSGVRVLLPRMPRHGQADLLTRDLENLTADELTAHVDTCIDIAAGFGDPVWVLGLSAGAVLAAWGAATRGEVERLALVAPLVAPKGLPLPLLRLLVRFPKLVPNFYLWWDPRKKRELGHSPYAYPGFPMPGILPFLHLSESLFDHSVEAGHRLERTVLVSNPGDFAIRRDAALRFAEELFFPYSAVCGVAGIDPSTRWMHDFVDPHAPNTGTTEQVTAIMAAAFGIGEPTAGGVLVPPLVPVQP